MNFWRKLGLVSFVLVVMLAAFFAFVMARIDASPLRAGATADEAWTYIHTNSLVAASSRYSPLLAQRSNWRADPRSIQQETCFYWRTNHLFATRITTFSVNTNSVITGASSNWKFTWPF